VKVKACDIHILGLPRCLQQSQDTHALPDMIGADPACRTAQVDFFKPFVSEATDHNSV
jgi:hypothetical protein